jgi:hypothetical protein
MTVGQKTGGRQVGTPNKATQEARQAISTFVNGNAHRLTEWLDKVADGDPEYEIKPNPAKAFELFQSVVEYHIPKLARLDHTGQVDGHMTIDVKAKEVVADLVKNIELKRQLKNAD